MAETEAGLDSTHNPDWTDDQNRRYNTLDQTTGLPPATIRRIALQKDALSEGVEIEPAQLESPSPVSKSSRSSVPVTGSYQKEMADNTRKSTDENERLNQQSKISREPTQEAPPRAIAASKEMVDGIKQKRIDEAMDIPPGTVFGDS